MASAAERVVVLMPPDEKSQLEKRARGAKLSIGEYVRRSISAYDPAAEVQAQELMQLVAEVNRTHREAVAALDAAEAALRSTFAYFESKGSGAPPSGKRRSKKGSTG